MYTKSVCVCVYKVLNDIYSSYNNEVKSPLSLFSQNVWFHSPRYDADGLLSLLLKVGNSTVDCKNFSYAPDPEFTGFTTLLVASDLQVNIQVSLVLQ